jgi:CheY-like chemotaxis protein
VRPDVLISDIAMPSMSGYDLARRIRENAAGPQPVLVALTGYGQPRDKEEALAAGFDDHLTKPIGIDGLRALLRTLSVRCRRSAAPVEASRML